ncbi:MAG: RNA methyltransferase [Chloroflexi bacterium RBG_16_54_18]|nr:MAG: RNA methyltransferase [Chloroflexi bacterium RBG_16_54_18]
MAFSEALAVRVRSYLAGMPLLVEKRMFGGISFLLQGNMACGVHGENLIVRVDPTEYEEILSQQYVRPFDMTGKPMKGWIFVTPEGVERDQELESWIDKGVEFARKLPAK